MLSFGGTSDDLLFGGMGSDTLVGDIGSNGFVLAAGGGIDTIFNFTQGVDTIVWWEAWTSINCHLPKLMAQLRSASPAATRFWLELSACSRASYRRAVLGCWVSPP